MHPQFSPFSSPASSAAPSRAVSFGQLPAAQPGALSYGFGLSPANQLSFHSPSTSQLPSWSPSSVASTPAPANNRRRRRSATPEDDAPPAPGDDDAMASPRKGGFGTMATTPRSVSGFGVGFGVGAGKKQRVEGGAGVSANAGPTTGKRSLQHSTLDTVHGDGVDLAKQLAQLSHPDLLSLVTSLVTTQPTLRPLLISLLPTPTLSTLSNRLSTREKAIVAALPSGGVSTQRAEYIWGRVRNPLDEYLHGVVEDLANFSSASSSNRLGAGANGTTDDLNHPSTHFTYLHLVVTSIFRLSASLPAASSPFPLLLTTQVLQSFDDLFTKLRGRVLGKDMVQGWFEKIEALAVGGVGGQMEQVMLGIRERMRGELGCMMSPSSSTNPSGRRVRTLPFPLADDPPTSTPLHQVPSAHFLSQTHVPRPPSPPTTGGGRNWIDSARPDDTTSLAGADYDVSVVSGFLPPEEPIRSLKGLDLGGGWDEVEDVLAEAQDEVKGFGGDAVGRVSQRWRDKVRALAEPQCAVLPTLPHLRRAHVLLSFLSHFYVHSTYPALTSLPKTLAKPWCIISERLGLPPILTFADTVLWNWHLKDPKLGLIPSNVAITTTFTSTNSESSFFLLSLLCDMVAPPILRSMSSTYDEAFFADLLSLQRISNYLLTIASHIAVLTKLIDDATKGEFGEPSASASAEGKGKGKEQANVIVPAEFYWFIRPWFNGGEWTYEGVGPDGEDVAMNWGGPSAGQSSLVHALDLFLQVDHSPRPSSSSSAPAPSPAPTANAPPPRTDETFMSRMSSYMPSPHRSFLTHLSTLPRTLPSARSLSSQHPTLTPAYNTAVQAMKVFRDSHFKLVARFIIGPSRSEPGRESVFWDEWEKKRVEKERQEVERKRVEAEAAEARKESGEGLKGTGGTELVKFLKTCRERTKEAILEGEEQVWE
ncbi:indoleamine 2,3-dioxygenase [Pseudohyphozyma bogoriensis]|nr:indoleamine 2,3-dioxygenase [Pseudohyphozyma bogoriensis]